MKLRITGVELAPWFEISHNGNVEKYSGPVGNTFTILSELMKLNFALGTPADHEWGVLKNGTWSGMIGMLYRNEADLAIGPFAMTFGRFQVVDFTTSLITNYIGILSGKTNEEQSDLFNALLSFDRYVWFGIGVSFLVLLALLTLTEKALVTRKSTVRTSSTISRYAWTLTASLFCKSSPKTPRFSPSRILLTFWWLSIMVLMNGFSGNLKAMLLLSPYTKRIDTIADVLENPSLKILIHKGTAYEAYFRESSVPEFRELWARALKTESVLSTKDLYNPKTLRDVQLRKSVIVSDFLTMANAVSRFCRILNNGSFYFGKQLFFPHTLSMAIKKDLSRKVYNAVKKSTRRIIEAGLFNHWLDKMTHNWTLCNENDGQNTHEHALKMKEMKAIFLLWFIGIGISTFTFFCEVLFNACFKRK